MRQKYYCDFPLLIQKSAIRSKLQTTALESTGPRSDLHLALADTSSRALPAATPRVPLHYSSPGVPHLRTDVEGSLKNDE